MSGFADIGVEKHGHVTLIEIRRPPLNFFDLSLIRQIADENGFTIRQLYQHVASARGHFTVVGTATQIADTLVMVYPNAGLPNDLGAYDELPEETAALVRDWAIDGQVNKIGRAHV